METSVLGGPYACNVLKLGNLLSIHTVEYTSWLGRPEKKGVSKLLAVYLCSLLCIHNRQNCCQKVIPRDTGYSTTYAFERNGSNAVPSSRTIQS